MVLQDLNTIWIWMHTRAPYTFGTNPYAYRAPVCIQKNNFSKNAYGCEMHMVIQDLGTIWIWMHTGAPYTSGNNPYAYGCIHMHLNSYWHRVKTGCIRTHPDVWMRNTFGGKHILYIYIKLALKKNADSAFDLNLPQYYNPVGFLVQIQTFWLTVGTFLVGNVPNHTVLKMYLWTFYFVILDAIIIITTLYHTSIVSLSKLDHQ